MTSIKPARTPAKQPLLRDLEHILCTNQTVLSHWDTLSCVALKKKDNCKCTRKREIRDHVYKIRNLVEEIENAGEVWEASQWVADIDFIMTKVLCDQHQRSKGMALHRFKEWKEDHGISEDHILDNDPKQADCEEGDTLTEDTSFFDQSECAEKSDDVEPDTKGKHNKKDSPANNEDSEVNDFPNQIDVLEGNQSLQNKPSADSIGAFRDSHNSERSHSVVSSTAFSRGEPVYGSSNDLAQDDTFFSDRPSSQSEIVLPSIEIDDDGGSFNGMNYVLSNSASSQPDLSTPATVNSDSVPLVSQLAIRGLPDNTPCAQADDRKTRLDRLKQTMTGSHAALYEAITAEATPRDLEEGVLYICKREATSFTNLFYVGFSSGDPSIDVANSCYVTTSSLEWKSQRSFQGAWRAKKIALASLRSLCQPNTSEPDCSSTETCKLNHRDWFQVDRGQLDDTVNSWAQFVGLAYNAQGSLTDTGVLVMEILCQTAYKQSSSSTVMSAKTGDKLQASGVAMNFEDLLSNLTAQDVHIASQHGERGVRESAKALFRRALGSRPGSRQGRNSSHDEGDHGKSWLSQHLPGHLRGRTSRESTPCDDDLPAQTTLRSRLRGFRRRSNTKEVQTALH